MIFGAAAKKLDNSDCFDFGFGFVWEDDDEELDDMRTSVENLLKNLMESQEKKTNFKRGEGNFLIWVSQE